jgi:murein DD-endopeptidase MepM/ murein hydrolase activator NlpD
LDAPTKVVRRWATVIVAVTLAAAPAGATSASPARDEPGERDRTTSDATLVDVDVLVSTNAAAVATELADLATQIAEQLEAFNTARAEVAKANERLVEADSALHETEFLIEEKIAESDEVVVDAFVNPPSESAFEVLEADNLVELTVKETLLGMEADRNAATLTALEEALARYEELEAEQHEVLNAAHTARAEADARLADLEASLSAQARFVVEVQRALDEQQDEPPPSDPEAAAEREQRLQEIAGQLQEAAELAAIREAERLAALERERRLAAGGIVCPVDGNVDFIDSWGFARSGGRTHKGVDMMAARGTPTVAPVSGQVVHRGSSLGGLSWYVYGDNGNTYYGTHLDGYENVGVGHVEAGTTIGYVGDSGNAAGNPHLHFEIRPGGGSAINPYPATAQACFG